MNRDTAISEVTCQPVFPVKCRGQTPCLCQGLQHWLGTATGVGRGGAAGIKQARLLAAWTPSDVKVKHLDYVKVIDLHSVKVLALVRQDDWRRPWRCYWCGTGQRPRCDCWQRVSLLLTVWFIRASEPEGRASSGCKHSILSFPPYFLRNGWTNQVRPIYGKWSVRGTERQVYKEKLISQTIENVC